MFRKKLKHLPLKDTILSNTFTEISTRALQDVTITLKNMFDVIQQSYKQCIIISRKFLTKLI